MSIVLGVVLPGTSITPLVETALGESDDMLNSTTKNKVPIVKLGSGLVQVGEDITAVVAGLLYFSRPNRFWIEKYQKRVHCILLPYSSSLVVCT